MSLRRTMNKKGMTLVEILIALGLTGLLAVATGSQMVLLSKWGSYSNTFSKYYEFNFMVEALLAGSEQCGKLLNLPLTVTLPVAGAQADTNIRSFSIGPTPFAKAGTQFGNLTISSIVLSLTGNGKTIDGSTNTLYQAFIQISTKRSANSLGSPALTHQYPLKVEVDTNKKVVTCASIEFTGGKASLMLPTSPCNSFSILKPSPDYLSTECQNFLCNTSECTNDCLSPGAGLDPATHGGYTKIRNSDGTYSCQMITCPLGMAPVTFTQDGYLSKCASLIN